MEKGKSKTSSAETGYLHGKKKLMLKLTSSIIQNSLKMDHKPQYKKLKV